MRTAGLEEAVREIAEASAKDAGAFFFLVGAGISAPEVPLAALIADDCRDRANRRLGGDDPGPAAAMDAYSYWFEKAFPQPLHRQQYLQEMLQDTRISAAALRLAHVVADGAITRLVVTPNFDESVERALAIFSIPTLVCDHPATVERINPNRGEVQVVHVHGTYWYYDCCNLRGEIASRADDRVSSLTMQSLLDRVLATSSPIVLGYSGWESDVFMVALRRRLSARLPYNLYWFCYSSTDVVSLPVWLLDHQDVVVIAPPDNESDEPVEDEARASDQRLPAAAVLEGMIRQMNLDPPIAITNPLESLVAMFERQLPGTTDASDGADIYQLRGVLGGLRALAAHYSVGEGAIESAEDAVRRSNYDRAVDICLANIAGSPDAARFASILASSITRVRASSTRQLELFVLALEALKPFAMVGSVRVPYRSALHAYARLLISASMYEASLPVLDEVVSLAQADPSDASLRLLRRAHSSQATALAKLERWEEALAACEHAIAVDTGAEDARELIVVKANRGTALLRLGRLQEAVDQYRLLEPDLRPGSGPFWRVYLRLLEALTALGDRDATIAAASRVITVASEADEKIPEMARALQYAEQSLAALQRAQAGAGDEAAASAGSERRAVRDLPTSAPSADTRPPPAGQEGGSPED